MNSYEDVWGKVIDILKADLTPTAIETWFNDCSAIDINNNTLVLVTPSTYKKGIIENRYLPLIKNALYEIFSGDFDVTILTTNEAEVYKTPKSGEESSVYDIYTFENFVVGKSNLLAHSAAIAVAEGRTNTYNPLFIYGNSGLGKTHLLHAIRLKIRQNHPEYNIVCVSGEEFTNELIEAIRSGKNIDFREKYRYANLFLMDDIQFIAGKMQTQEEFFNTFNALYEAGCQLVFTSDRPPSEISLLETRLLSRFESGLITDVSIPDYETRIAIIKNKATQLGIIIEDEIADYIANNIKANIRQLEGTVKKIKAYQDLMNEKLNVHRVAEVISDFYQESSEALTPDLIIEETANYFNLKPEDLKGQSRVKNIVNARQIAMKIIRDITNKPHKDIGTYFQNRDHSTVLVSIQKVEASLLDDKKTFEIIRDITSNINTKTNNNFT